MRVLFVVYELPPIGGGVANAAHHLLAEFSKQKNMVIDVVTSSVTNAWEINQLYKNITIHSVPIGNKKNRLQKQSPLEMLLFTIHSLRKISQLQNRNTYTVTHCFGYPSALPGYLFKRKNPYIISLRGVDVPGYNKKFGIFYTFFTPIAKLTWKHARSIIVNSQGLKALAIKTLSNRKMSIIPNGVDTTLFKPIAYKKKFSKFTVTAGGTVMGPKKGLEYLIRGFADFHNIYPNSQLLLMGSGSMEDELKALVKCLDISQAVRFTGALDHVDVAQLLPKCHVMCLPSLAEGMSNAVSEAAACGLPLVLTDVGGTKELLKQNGFIIKQKNIHQITKSLLAVSNTTKNRYMSKKSRDLSQSLTWNKTARMYLNEYEYAK